MPDFTIKGDPGAVRARAGLMREKGSSFVAVGESLATVTTDGWTGRAAERFREKFDAEPGRWHDAGSGFQRAAAALETYAGALQDAQRRAEWARGEHQRGEQVTVDARAAYDADVARARREVSEASARGEVMTLTIVPFADPGQAVREGALAELGSARADLEEAAQVCAAGVRAGCAGAPEKRHWVESAGAAVGGFFAGAGEAVWDLGKLVTSPVWRPIADAQAVLSGDLTVEELAMRNRLTVEQAGGMLQALKDDPVGFGQQLGKAVLDWDTWADDPARALGRLLPDAVAAIATAGVGAAATRGLKGVDALRDLAALGRGVDGLDDLNDARRGADGPGDVTDLRHLDDLADGDMPGEAPAPTVQTPDDIRAWLDGVNPNYTGSPHDPYSSNCGSCSVSVHDGLEGNPVTPAGPSTLDIPGMEAAIGRPQVTMQPDEIADELIAGGPGSHAVVGIDRAHGPGHWFNAYYDGKRVYAVDGQTGQIIDWPPSYGAVNWDAAIVRKNP